MVTVTRCIKDEQINILAMTEGVYGKEGLFHQTILCKNREKAPVEKEYGLLIPKMDAQSYYTKSKLGESYQEIIKSKYGSDLSGFRNTYVAQVVTAYELPNNSPALWRQICDKLFLLWDPTEGPYKHIKEHNSNIILFRVYIATELVNKYVSPKRTRTARLVNSKGVDIALNSPVVDDVEFQRQKNILEEFLRK